MGVTMEYEAFCNSDLGMVKHAKFQMRYCQYEERLSSFQASLPSTLSGT